MSAKTFTREQVIKAVQDAADAWQPNLGTSFEKMVAGFLFNDNGYVEPEYNQWDGPRVRLTDEDGEARGIK